MFEVLPITSGNLFAFRVSQKIEKEDIIGMVGMLEPAIKEMGMLRLYFEMHDFHGWTASAFWSDLSFDVKYGCEFTHIAMVGETSWQEWMTTFMKPFTTAKLKFFSTEDKADAVAWITSKGQS